METDKFWEENSIEHIIPKIGQEFPEGWNILEYLSTLFSPEESLVEVGCGRGRLSKAFSPSHYTGLDISKNALKIASESNPEYKYILSKQFPVSKHKLLYTVLLHISDKDIENFIKRLVESTEKTLVVAEVMGKDWRRKGDPPVFNREAEVYIELFKANNFELVLHEEKPYLRYKNWKKKNTNLHILKFKRVK